MSDLLVLKTQGLTEARSEIQLAPLGEFTDAEGRPFRVKEEDVALILADAAAKANDLVIDYEHQTLAGVQAPAAGWIKALVNKGKDGLWAVVEWTERAKGYLKTREYRYLSPVLLAKRKNGDGFYRPSALHSAALTNTPRIDGMAPIVNKREPQMGGSINPLTLPSPLRGEGNNEEGGRAMEKVFELLGLKTGAAEDDCVAALTALKNKAEMPDVKEVIPKELIEALGLKEGAAVSEVRGTVLALKQPGNVVSMTEFQSLKKRLAEKDRDELVALAMKAGKIMAAQKDWADGYALEDPEGFKVFIAKAPAVVPMDKAPARGKAEARLDEVQALVNKQLGISEDIFKKHNREGE